MAQNYNLTDVPALGAEVVVITDANILIFRYWSKINQTAEASRYRLAFFRLRNQGTPLVMTMGVLSEATNRVFKEQWKYWNKRQKRMGLTPIPDYKVFRDSPAGIAMKEVIDNIVKNKILKEIELVEKQFTNAEAAALFVAGKMDLTDRIIAAIACERGYIVFTHDGDFVHSDADILTENGKILKAKRGSPPAKVTNSHPQASTG
jgi:predicted nuclease of predicted toxin-antitoxin system